MERLEDILKQNNNNPTRNVFRRITGKTKNYEKFIIYTMALLLMGCGTEQKWKIIYLHYKKMKVVRI
jgi:hypothetical protein